MAIEGSMEWFWWLALLVQLLSIPGSLLPLLPGLVWLPLGAGIWCFAAGWSCAWPVMLLALVVFGLGLIADLLALGLASARLQASRWTPIGAGVGLLLGLFGLLPALPVGGPLIGALFGPWLGAAVVEAVVITKPPQNLGWLVGLRRGCVVGLAVVAGLLVSRLAQVALSLVGVCGFLVLTLL